MKLTPVRAWLIAGLTVGVLDYTDAMIFFGIRVGATPVSIAHSIASVLIGAKAKTGGYPTAALGLAMHFGIALSIAGVFFLAASRIPALRKRPLITGPIYGIIAYCMMNFVVLPMVGGGGGVAKTPALINGVMIHMFGVGLPCAWFASKALWKDSRS